MQRLNIAHIKSWICLAAGILSVVGARAAEPDFRDLQQSYATDIRPLVIQFCGECHSDERAEAELNLATMTTFADVRKNATSWLKVLEMLDSEQMPPTEAKQPSTEERLKLHNWVRRFLREEAKQFAGDPGPAVLRRLTNAEYTYAIGDLTGVTSLRPAREFPVDGAAGEGFTNAGNALVMSPSLLGKYLDAGKDVAEHAVLLPNGIRFSSRTTRRDWTEEILGEIRDLYSIYSDSQGGSQVNLQGIVFDTNGGGRLPIDKYLAATIAERENIRGGKATIPEIARQRGLSPKYLAALWSLLAQDPASRTKSDSPGTTGKAANPQREIVSSSLLVDPLREHWRLATPEQVPHLNVEIAQWQKALWRFTSVGHIGKVGGPKAWMEPVDPLVARHELRLKVPAATDGKDVVLYLVTGDAGDGNEHDIAIWERPRLVAQGRSDLLLRDVRSLAGELASHRERLVASAAKCLTAAADANSPDGVVDVQELAKRHQVEPDMLAAWLDYVGIGTGGPAKIGSPITRKATSSAGYDFVQGWVGDEALSVVANSSDQHVRIPGNMAPHSVAVHPTPSLQVVVGWRSPAAAILHMEGVVQHAHPECGNGVAWSLKLRRGNTRQRLATGTAQGANKVPIGPLDKISVQRGDLVTLVIGPRDGNHSCDLTSIDLTLREMDPAAKTSPEAKPAAAREWNLARDISPDILAGNPHPDRLGNAEVWHFFSEPTSGATGHVIPAGSLMARWQSTVDPQERKRIAEDVQRLLQTGGANLPGDSQDSALYRQLTSLGGPLFASALQAIASKGTNPNAKTGDSTVGLDPALFGKYPKVGPVSPASESQGEKTVDAASFCVPAPSILEVRLPADLVAGAEFVTSGILHSPTGKEGSVQFQVLTSRPQSATGIQPTAVTVTNGGGPWTSNNRGVSHATPIVVTEGSAARRRIEQEFDEFRRWFPPALCYTKIVPVDEVVTLTLYYREDEHLKRLMLDDLDAARLDRLWDELHFVSHDALTLVDALAQLLEYATQDADPKVFEPMKKPVQDRADAFRQRLVSVQPQHVAAVFEFASRAYRRPLRESEMNRLRGLYQSLRKEDLGHDEAVRLLIARILVSPEFLYRPEKAVARVASTKDAKNPAPNTGDAALAGRAAPVTDWELATRLSFFLWSSVPDGALREAASQGQLRDPAVLLAQTRRMVQDDRVRRLATEFACQWLHIYDFESHDEKSEAAFPTFAGLRGAMYEESIRFFTDLCQRDGSVLEVLDADHTFVNADLARHYGIPAAQAAGKETDNNQWRRVDRLKSYGRGGILGMASTLAKQSGASRTSPILRGNWISEALLGDKLPKPPKGVPVLPEVVPVGLTERQLIEQHSSVAACAKCHARIDPLGFALENFDAIGRTRSAKANGEGAAAVATDTRSKLRDGTELDGLDGLRTYLVTTRRDDFVRQFCRKLLGYALGRAVILSDEPLLDEMQSRLKNNGYRIGVAVETIVQSPQFRMVSLRTDDVKE